MVSVGRMANGWLIFSSSFAIVRAHQNIHVWFSCICTWLWLLWLLKKIAQALLNWLKERLVPTAAACSSLIRTFHQIWTEIQMSNENSSTWQRGGLVCHVPRHIKRELTAKWWHMKGEAKWWGVLKPLWCCNNAETPRFQPARWLISTPPAAPAAATLRVQRLLWRGLTEICPEDSKSRSAPWITVFARHRSDIDVVFSMQITQQG